jgi:starch synthase (maltosyl-transferring)
MTEMTTFASRQDQFVASFDGDVRPSSAQVLSNLSQSRVAIERVWPQIQGGRFAVKRAVGDVLTVDADIYSDGHDRIAAALLLRREGEANWQEVLMRGLDNDRWRGEVPLGDNGRYYFTIIAWRDLFSSWQDEISKKHSAGLAVDLELEEGRMIIEKALQGEPRGGDPGDLQALRLMLERHADDPDGTSKLEWLTSRETGDLMARVGPRTSFTRYDRELEVWVDRRKAAFSAWYEMFPRSQSGDAGRHGTFADVIARLPYVRDLGFDVLYFTPIHPIGRTNRKGRNNSLKAEAGDAGSPYAIGSAEGGHDAIHPQLGTFADFERLVSEARAHDLEIALDFAIQCSPDHPWIKEHPEWFDWRPDGTIKFAENPPKKYEDIVNVHFYRGAFPAIWYALRDIVLFWSERGVRIFRVDNPHTKPFPFWEWLIRQVHGRFPDVIFLSEAFTRPKPMMRLAKLGYTQSYTYFTWRNTKHELTEYLVELTRSEAREYFRPNFFVNTPDINPYYLQTSGRPGFRVRLILAATLVCNYGIYNGFELCEGRPIPGKEEYLDSEKYEIKAWDWERPGHIRDDIRLINRLRRERPALQQFQHLNFYNAWNDHILYYGKFTPDKQDFVLVAVNLDPHTPQGCHFEVPLWEFGLPDASSVDVEDLVTGNRFTWTGKIQHMLLDPSVRPYAIWRLSNRQASR